MLKTDRVKDEFPTPTSTSKSEPGIDQFLSLFLLSLLFHKFCENVCNGVLEKSGSGDRS